MRFLLDIGYLLAMAALAPLAAWKALWSERWRAGWGQRLGFGLPRRQDDAPCVWIHAVSVGEASLIRTMVDTLLREHPAWRVAVSTFTNTGQNVARERFGGRAMVFYYPLDLSFVVRRALRRIRPTVICLIELEIWPNFVAEARRAGVPVVIANGRMREERVAKYRRFWKMWAALADPSTGNAYCVQNETYADRFRRAGFPPEKISVTGSMKYDALATEAPAGKLAALRQAFGLAPGDTAWIGACTWPGEEAACLRVHRRLRQRWPELRLILAPRHIERAAEVAREIEAAGFACRRRTAAGPAEPGAVGLLDTVGELSAAYGLARAAFVGKSLLAQGGHNVLEPAAMGVATLFGPRTDNFEDETRMLLAAGGAALVDDEEGLYNKLSSLLADVEACGRMAQAGKRAVMEHRGATRRTLDVVERAVARRMGGSDDPTRETQEG
ncbi:MAG TPA: 3-deoxy-D-manno-octulosonic acid transferase [Candidatus Brocadiia bacterium]|nr:3-deoxy-D-manno-octulosonic acid transferase [Candidatus Brocadiia bacterium]